jgi:pyrimidine operon attenuation protein/uracil phosphoribosyltransferase
MTDSNQSSERDLMTGAEVRRALARMAHEIIERNHGAENLLIAGIPTRGSYLSIRLADFIESFETVRPYTAILDPSSFRDDANRRRENGVNGAVPSNGMGEIDISGMRVVVVDDVFHTGRTARAALDALMQSGRPAYVQLAVLINRGHRELPINPDFVGRNVPTSRAERVDVRLTEVDGEDRVAISRFASTTQTRGLSN